LILVARDFGGVGTLLPLSGDLCPLLKFRWWKSLSRFDI